MRIAAGVLIIIVGVLNLFPGLLYLGLGTLASGAAAAADVNKAVTSKITDPVEAAKAQEQLAKVAEMGSGVGKILLALGALFLVLIGLDIAAGVVLFMGRAKTFAMIVGILQIVANAAGCILLKHLGVLDILGFLAGIFVIVAAMTYRAPSVIPPAYNPG